jgi:Zn-dependent M32 family carboxypeptidase
VPRRRPRYAEQLADIESKLDVLIWLTRRTAKDQQIMADDLTDLIDSVAQNSDVVSSAVEAFDGLVTRLEEALASNDPAAIAAVTDDLRANTQRLADAVAAVPAEGAPAEPPA